MTATEGPGPVPVLLLTGALGAGKTTQINRLLTGAHGRRIAAIVNDFGAINIDAALIEGQSEEIIGLSNGCICCSLQGDLLRSLKTLLARPERPEMIVIEASGVSDPMGILEAVQDPVLFGHVTLASVACVLDGPALADDPAQARDPLWQAQVAAADFGILSKAATLPDPARARLTPLLATHGLSRLLQPERDGAELDLLLLAPAPQAPRAPGLARAPVSDAAFTRLEWTRPGPLNLPAFQRALQSLAPGLLRAKGFLDSAQHPGVPLLLQLVGRRATVEKAPAGTAPGCRLVLIGRAGVFDPEVARARLDTC